MPSTPHIDNDSALIQACKKGNLKEVKRLLPLSNPQTHNSVAIRWAAEYGCLEIVQLLAPLSNLHSQGCFAVQAAAVHGRVEILKCLLEYDIPPATQRSALELAAPMYNPEIFKLLIPGSNYQQVLHNIQQANAARVSYGQIDTTVLEQCIEEYENEQQRLRLETAVGSLKPSHARKI